MSEERVRAAAPGALAFAAVVVLSATEGGYFALTWGWVTLGLLVTLGAAALFLERIEVGRLDAALLVGFTALAVWVVLSAVWSDSLPRSVLEGLRMLLYLVAVAAFALLALRESAPWLLGGVWAAATAVCGYAIAAHLLDDSPPARLSGPLGYWNALALLAAIGALLAVGLVLDSDRRLRIAAASSLAVFVATLVLTESRGTWLALLTGIAIAAFADPRLRRMPTRGRRVAFVAAGAVALVAMASALLLAGKGGQATDAFRGTSPRADVPLRVRLLNVSSSGRDEYWRVAWKQYSGNRALGSGAGTYDIYWHRERRTIYGAHDAHSLYLETLAELGPIGLALLLAALGVPIVGAYRARGRPLVGPALGAYATYLVHAGLDWDWEMPAVTVAALACGAALVIAARGAPASRPLVRAERIALVTPVAALAAVVAFWHAGNGALAESDHAMARSDFLGARLAAERAERLAPWASSPHAAVAEADLALGDIEAARASAQEGLDRDPLDWRLWFLLSVTSQGSEREDALAEAARLNPLSAEVRAFQKDVREAKNAAQRG